MMKWHLENFTSYNPWIDEDIAAWKKRLVNRPK